MRPRRGILLFVVGLIVLAGGWYFGPASQALEQPSAQSGQLLFPGLAPKLAAAARIELVHGDKTLTIEKKGETWGLADRGGYPVLPSKLHALLAGLTEIRLTEPRTADPALFSRLGVDDPHAASSTATLVTVLDQAGKPIVAVIAGHQRTRMQGNLPDSLYVRLPSQNQAWLAEGKLEADADPQLWLDRDILNIGPAHIAGVRVSRGGAHLGFGREGDKLVLTEPADHPPLETYKVDDVGRALDSLSFQDVRPAHDAPGQQTGQSVFTTDDGLTVTVTLARADKDVWAQFAVSGNDKAKQEADRLNRKLAGWAYQLGSWKEQALAPTLDELKAPPPKPETKAPAAKP